MEAQLTHYGDGGSRRSWPRLAIGPRRSPPTHRDCSSILWPSPARRGPSRGISTRRSTCRAPTSRRRSASREIGKCSGSKKPVAPYCHFFSRNPRAPVSPRCFPECFPSTRHHTIPEGPA